MFRRLIGLSGVFLALLLGGCQPADATPAAQTGGALTPVVLISTDLDGEVVFEIGIHNEGDAQPENENFSGHWEVVTADGDLRAEGDLLHMGPLPAGGDLLPLRWEGVLDPGEYIMRWGAPGYGSTVIEFEVIDRDGSITVGDQDVWAGDDFPPPERIPGRP